jgi:two-component system OmpR family response regulator
VYRLLILEPDRQDRSLLKMALSFVGFDIEAALSAHAASTQVADFDPDLVLVGIAGDARESLAFLRRFLASDDATPMVVLAPEGAVPSLLASGVPRSSIEPKPIDLEHLAERIRSLLVPACAADHLLRVGDLVLDTRQGTTTRGGVDVSLTPTEFRLLRLLVQRCDHVLSKREILDQVWEYDFGGKANVVETYVSYLRRKLDPLGPPLIRTVRGAGYVLRRPPIAEPTTVRPRSRRPSQTAAS